MQKWVLARLRRLHARKMERRDAVVQAQQKAYKEYLARLENLLRLKTSPENADGRLVTNEEYAAQRAVLLKEKECLEEALEDGRERTIERMALLGQVFEFTRQARSWLAMQDHETKRLLLAVFATGDSNLTLGAKPLRIDAPKPFPTLEELPPGILGARRDSNLTKAGSIEGKGRLSPPWVP